MKLIQDNIEYINKVQLKIVKKLPTSKIFLKSLLMWHLF